MVEPTEDDGTIVALLERFRTQRLPRALDIKEKVDQGQRLDDGDIAFLEMVLADAKRVTPLLDSHPDFRDLAARTMHLYNEITKQALKNEEQG